MEGRIAEVSHSATDSDEDDDDDDNGQSLIMVTYLSTVETYRL